MIRAVFDANVLAAGAAGFRIPTSVPGQLLRVWLAGQVELIASEHVLSEVRHTLDKPYFRSRLTLEQIVGFRMLLRRRAILTPLTVEVQGVATHPGDDVVLATAMSGGADHLVTGDRELRTLGSYQGVTILSPRTFLSVLEQDEPTA